MFDLTTPRGWDDETLESALSLIATLPDLKRDIPDWVAKVEREAESRAELRLVRGEPGSYAADWYKPRPLTGDAR